MYNYVVTPVSASLPAIIGPIGNYALNRVIAFADFFNVLHITPGGLALGIREVCSFKITRSSAGYKSETYITWLRS